MFHNIEIQSFRTKQLIGKQKLRYHLACQSDRNQKSYPKRRKQVKNVKKHVLRVMVVS